VINGKLEVELAARKIKAVFKIRQYERLWAPGVCPWPQDEVL
jgi:hypothetical protein